MNENFSIAFLPLPACPQYGNIDFDGKDTGSIQREGYNAKDIYKCSIKLERK